ncbi:hypothetical protein PIB30_061846 [Stylosanthes scabra]|uniref:Uncharacterized protein n=1 Tax=Stylosanthes scabra TaxID=79078 RepID=A0ABU6TKT5_9FABA|nr:hypothetical protein [Stylosanthes scabra]
MGTSLASFFCTSAAGTGFPVQPRRQIHTDPESRVSLSATAARWKFVHLLVWLFNDEHVRVTFVFHRRLMPQHVMDFLVDVGRIPAAQSVAATTVQIAEPPAPETEAAMGHSEEDDSDYATSTASSSDAQEGGDGGAETRSASCPRYILPAPPPIPRVEDVPCFFQQLDLDEGA